MPEITFFSVLERPVRRKTVKTKDDITQRYSAHEVDKYNLFFNTIGTIRYQKHHIKEP